MTLAMRSIWAIVAFDLGREARRPVASGAVLVFGVSALVVLRLALSGGGKPSSAVLAGALWVILVFAAIIGTARAWSAEREEGSLDALLAAPTPRWVVHVGKVLAALGLTMLLHLVLVLLYVATFAGPSGGADIALLLGSVLLADAGFASVGVLVAGLGMRARSRDLIGPVLFLPLVIPLVIAAVSATLVAYDSSSTSALQLLGFLALYDLTFLVGGCAAFPELAVE
jgi:heme exporter protein B